MQACNRPFFWIPTWGAPHSALAAGLDLCYAALICAHPGAYRDASSTLRSRQGLPLVSPLQLLAAPHHPLSPKQFIILAALSSSAGFRWKSNPFRQSPLPPSARLISGAQWRSTGSALPAPSSRPLSAMPPRIHSPLPSFRTLDPCSFCL